MRKRDLDPDPIVELRRWLRDAEQAGIRLPEAMTLATASRDGAPSARLVLLKGVDERGLVFYTSYASRKGRELAENPRAALVLYWEALGRQLRAEGRVERVSAAASDAYFASREPASRVSAAASPQSDPVESRDALEARVRELWAEHPDGAVPRPPHWGGFRLSPEAIEFWEHRDDRLHDRLRYRRVGEGWTIERLGP